MGVGHIVLIREDAIGSGGKPREGVAQALGEALLGLCLTPTYRPELGGPVRQRTAQVLGWQSAIEWAGEHESEDEQIFVWGGNGLQNARLLTVEQLKRVREGVTAIIAEKERDLT